MRQDVFRGRIPPPRDRDGYTMRRSSSSRGDDKSKTIAPLDAFRATAVTRSASFINMKRASPSRGSYEVGDGLALRSLFDNSKDSPREETRKIGRSNPISGRGCCDHLVGSRPSVGGIVARKNANNRANEPNLRPPFLLASAILSRSWIRRRIIQPRRTNPIGPGVFIATNWSGSGPSGGCGAASSGRRTGVCRRRRRCWPRRA